MANDKDKVTATYYSKSGAKLDPQVTFKLMTNADFPEHQKLFQKGKKHHEYAISIGILRKLLKCLPKDGTLCLGFNEGKADPVEFRVHQAGITEQGYDEERPTYGLIMPMFVQWSGVEWQRARKNNRRLEWLRKRLAQRVRPISGIRIRKARWSLELQPSLMYYQNLRSFIGVGI
jgi:hypothetical protein